MSESGSGRVYCAVFWHRSQTQPIQLCRTHTWDWLRDEQNWFFAVPRVWSRCLVRLFSLFTVLLYLFFFARVSESMWLLGRYYYCQQCERVAKRNINNAEWNNKRRLKHEPANNRNSFHSFFAFMTVRVTINHRVRRGTVALVTSNALTEHFTF